MRNNAKNKIIVKLERIFLPCLYTFFFPVKKGIDERSNIIVSMTSYPQRLRYVNKSIKSLLRQSMKPKKIILYLGPDTKRGDIPRKLEKLKKRGLEIVFVNEDLKPHKKYYYSLQQYRNSYIVTVDDDAIYDKHLIKSLMQTSIKYPKAIVGRTIRIITSQDHKIVPYREWLYANHTDYFGMSHSLIAVGVGGVLYPPGVMPDKTFDKENIEKLCLYTDDLWLKFNEVKSNIPVVNCPSKYFVPVSIERHQKKGLFVQNVLQDKNDINIRRLETFFSLKLEEYAIERVDL